MKAVPCGGMGFWRCERCCCTVLMDRAMETLDFQHLFFIIREIADSGGLGGAYAQA
jgi:hypothetical protein